MREVFADTYIRRGVAADASAARADALVSAVIGLDSSARAGASREELAQMAAGIHRELIDRPVTVVCTETQTAVVVPTTVPPRGIRHESTGRERRRAG